MPPKSVRWPARSLIDTQPQFQPQSQPQTQPQLQTQPQSQPQLQPQTQPQPQTQTQPQLQPQLQPQTQPQSQLQPQLQPQTQPQSQPQLQPQTQPQPQTQTQPQVESYTHDSTSTQLHTSHGQGCSSDGNLRTRGPARSCRTWGTGIRLEVELDDLLQPIGYNAAPFQTQLGVSARNGNWLPLTYTSWKGLPLELKEHVWEDVKANTNLPDEFKYNCFKYLGDKWKEWKSRIKRDHYKAYENDEDRLAHCPDRIIPDQWEALVKYWGTNDAKELSEINRTNRGKLKMNHATGRKAHSRLRDELKKKMGVTPDRVAVFIAARTKKNGDIVDEASTQTITRMNNRIAEVPESSRTPSFCEKVFTEIMGPDGHGRVRTYGLGPTPTDLFGKSSEKHNAFKRKYEEEAAKIGKMQEDIDLWKERCVAMEKKFEMLEDHVKNRGNMTNIAQEGQASRQVPDASSAHQPHLIPPIPHHQRDQELLSSATPPSAAQEVTPKVTLLGFKIPKKAVAKGYLVSKDPLKIVGGEPLGPGYWEVHVEEVVKPREKLSRPLEGVLTLREAKGGNIAWPADDVYER